MARGGRGRRWGGTVEGGILVAFGPLRGQRHGRRQVLQHPHATGSYLGWVIFFYLNLQKGSWYDSSLWSYEVPAVKRLQKQVEKDPKREATF